MLCLSRSLLDLPRRSSAGIPPEQGQDGLPITNVGSDKTEGRKGDPGDHAKPDPQPCVGRYAGHSIDADVCHGGKYCRRHVERFANLSAQVEARQKADAHPRDQPGRVITA